MRCTPEFGYPSNWTEISKRIKERDNYTCQFCGLQHFELIRRLGGELFERVSEAESKIIYESAKMPGQTINTVCKRFGITRVLVQTIHLHQPPSNVDDSNLLTACQRCHLKYDHNELDFNSGKLSEVKRPALFFD